HATCHGSNGQQSSILLFRSCWFPIFIATVLDDRLKQPISVEVTDVDATGNGVGGEIGEKRPTLGVDRVEGSQGFIFVGQGLVRLTQNELEDWPGVVNGGEVQFRGAG